MKTITFKEVRRIISGEETKIEKFLRILNEHKNIPIFILNIAIALFILDSVGIATIMSLEALAKTITGK